MIITTAVLLLLCSCSTESIYTPPVPAARKQDTPSVKSQVILKQESESINEKKEAEIDEFKRKEKEENWMARYKAIVDLNIFAIGLVEEHGTSSCGFARSTIFRHIQQFTDMQFEIKEFTLDGHRGNFAWLLDVHTDDIKEAYNSMCSSPIQ